ncbi:serine hydrolase domain-containing protein [Gynurincola endophyticus]|uniref:serine hydrolase domain-containing protein n=1 Tax=Gynurincola endophyticus TaxID=2479004 RepID=UPI0013151EE4|nr:serine hydrolase domain-containing protein [Gynurincola endophyticus]
MNKLIYASLKLYVCIWIVFSPENAVARKQLPDSTIAQLKIGIRSFQERYHSPSIAVAIVHGDSLIFSDAGGYIDLENKIPATVDARYQIQSVTKMFTATMFMQIWEKGVINGVDKVSKYVPEFSGDATYLELATHNSGLPRNSPADIDFARQVDKWFLTKKNESAISSAKKEAFIQSLAFVSKLYPSYEFLRQDTRRYSNLGYGLLGLALERAAGKDYETYILSNICKPLGLSNTGFGTVGTTENLLARGYYYLNDSAGFIRTPDYYSASMIPAGGMYSSALDMAKFISAQFDGNKEVLSAKGLRMMQQLGIGWMRNYPFITHEGSMLGARATIVVHPRLQIGWVILTNTTDFSFNRINEYIASLIVPVYLEKPIVDLVKYTGTYVLDGAYGKLEIYLKEGKLYSTYLQDMLPEQELYFSGENSLTVKGSNGHDIRYEFIPGKGNEFKALVLNQLLWKKE